MEILFIIGFICFLVFKWLDTESSNKNSGLTNNKSYTPSPIRRQSAELVAANDVQTVINRAIRSESTLKITYKDMEGRVTTRTITPKQLFITEGSGELALSSYCHLRREKRTFIVDRIIELDLL